jgi:CubicO group peptidase (beta-lactamase class C family)
MCAVRGMSGGRSGRLAGAADALEGLLQGASAAGVAPAYSLAVADRAGPLLELWGGQAELRPRPRPTAPEQPFDLASLTKVLLTTPLALALSAEGRLDLDAPLRELLAAAPAGVTARHCLQHSSGLPAWRPLWGALDGLPWGGAAARAQLAAVAMQTPVEAPPGAQHRYSDLGMILLGAALEAAGGDRLDRLWEAQVRAHTRADLRLGWPGAAATEDCPVRGRVIAGEVHDLNAAAFGGIAAHAGLFGSARSVVEAARAALRLWDGEGPAAAVALQRAAWSAPGPGSHRLGWDSPSGPGSSAGPRWPADGVGHLGFTGTSLWIAPRQGVICALLTNRVHPVIEGGAVPDAPPHPRAAAFRALRPAVHAELVRVLEAAGRWSP